MKHATEEQQQSANRAAKRPQELRLFAELEVFSYAKELRALGQALEKHHFSTLDLEVAGGIYFVRGKATVVKEAQSSFARLVRDLIYGYSAPTQEETNLSFSAEAIDQLDCEGRSKRKECHQLPDPYSLSQILRGAGSYLDHRNETSLVGITLTDRWVTLRYKTAEGGLEQAKQDLVYFYDYWVKMYLRRSNRPKLPFPSEPSLFVTWEGIKKRST